MDYMFDVPDVSDMQEGLNEQIDYWKTRNNVIRQMTMMIDGTNTIMAPQSTQYQIRTGHTYKLAGILNEKASRFLPLPQIQVVPDSDTPEARTKSTNLEQAIKIAQEEMERRGDGDVWSRVIFDAILLDEGVCKIEAAPHVFWPEMVIKDEDDKLVHQFESKDAITEYKKEHGFPIKSSYVSLDSFFPSYEASVLVESYELEYRTLRSLLRHPLYRGAVEEYTSNTKTGNTAPVTFITYANQNWCAYYAILSEKSARWSRQNSKGPISPIVRGTPVLLHKYKHGLGRSIYNCVAGRFGGWKTGTNRIEGSNKGLMELNQQLDNMYSQALTNIGAEYWPNLVQKIDPMLRGLEPGTPPSPARIKPGEPIVMFKDESLERAFIPANDPMFQWIWDKTEGQISQLGGSPLLTGTRQPGVDTGYHQALMISQAEHLDEKAEQHLVQGAINQTTLMLEWIKVLDEEMWVQYTEQTKTGKNLSVYRSIDPKDLRPMPRLDARVRKTRPVDFIASIRAFLDATSEREGKGPAMDDDTAREMLLGMDSPDIIERKILRQTQKNRVIQAGIIDRLVVEKIFQTQAKETTQKVDEQKMSEADPALMAAIGGSAGAAAGAGGISPDTLGSAAQKSANGPGRRQTGMASGDPQPEARIGEAVAAAANAGRV